MISIRCNPILVETIVPKEEKKPQETLVLKSDGTTQKLVHKSKISRTTSQEKHEKHEKQQKVTKVEKHAKVNKVEKVEKVEKVQAPKEPEKQEVNDKPRLGRALTSQEESILLPLLQGLLSANGSDASKLKHENTPLQEKEPPASNKNGQSNLQAEKNEKSE